MSDGSDDEGVQLFAPTKAKPVAKPQPLPLVMAAPPETKILPLVDADSEEEVEEEEVDDAAHTERAGEDENEGDEEDRDDASEEEVAEDGEEEVEEEDSASAAEEEDEEEDPEDGEEDYDDDDDDEEGGGDKKKVVKGLSEKKLQKWVEKNEKKGVIYLSRIPPFMRPTKIRDLLSSYGEVGRVYLKPEDTHAAQRRKKTGGNKKKKYVEGWVEFMDKEVAEAVAASLNATPVGEQVRKGSFFYNDLWCMKFLPNFKWHHLNEKRAYDNAVRSKRRRTEIQQVKRENNEYLLQVEKARTHKRFLEKRKRAAAEAGEPIPEDNRPEEAENDEQALEKMRGRFWQRQVSREQKEDIEDLLPNQKPTRGGGRKRQRVERRAQQDHDEPTPTGGDVSDDLLSMIFGTKK